MLCLEDYRKLICDVRENLFPITIEFGLEICYFKEFESFAADLTKGKGFDFLVGSVHFVDNFAFDHTSSFSLIERYEEMAEALSAHTMYAEQSSGIYRRCPQTAELGMHKDMLKYMKKHHVKIVTVSDAHCPDDVGSNISELQELAAKA